MSLHDGEELDDDLRGRTNKDLTFAPALRIDNVVLKQRLRKNSNRTWNRELTRQSFYTIN